MKLKLTMWIVFAIRYIILFIFLLNIIIYIIIYIMKYLFIDIRKSDEVYSKYFDQSQEYSFYNIPMNMIRFNAETIINHLKY
jgi:hypothetical protein